VLRIIPERLLKMEHSDTEEEEIQDEDEQQEEREHTKGNRFVSTVWQHFTTTEDGPYCNYCNAKYSPRTSTTPLHRHLSKYHKEVIDTGADDDNEQGVFDAQEMDRLLSVFIATNYLSLSIVDHQDFCALLTYVVPNYDIPGRKKLTRDLMPRLREELEAVMLTKMRSIRAFSLSVDSWTSMANEIFLALTCHGITSEWKLASFLLEAVPVYEDETGAHIAETVQEILDYWDISMERIVSITSDGAANMRNAVEAVLQVPWIYCAAHVINRAVRLGLDCDEVKPLIEKCKRISRFFRSSPKAGRTLLQRQHALHLPALRMKIDNKTRWGSAHDMLERLLKSRPAISACLALKLSTRRKAPDDLSPSEWKDVEGLLRVLKPVKDTTEYLSKEKHPTIGVVFPLVHRLLHHHLKVTTQTRMEDGDLVGAFKVTLRDDLSERWNTMTDFSPDIVFLSAFLDPRLKGFSFVTDATERSALKNKCLRMIEGWLATPQRYSPESSQGSLGERDNEEDEDNATPNRCMINRLFGESIAANISSSVGGPATYQEELTSYLQQAPLPLLERSTDDASRTQHTDPLVWWSTHQHNYPHLAKLAKRFLAVTSTSVPSERVFSRGGSIVSKKRCALTGSNVSMLMFIACNRHHMVI